MASSSRRNQFLARDVNRNTSLRIISQTRFLRSSGAIYKALTLSESRTSMTFYVSLFILAYISLCLCSAMTCSEKSSLRSHRPSLLRIQLYLDSCTLQLSMVSPRFSVIELPSFMLCSYCKQLIAIEKIWRADQSTEPLQRQSCLISLSATFYSKLLCVLV